MISFPDQLVSICYQHRQKADEEDKHANRSNEKGKWGVLEMTNRRQGESCLRLPLPFLFSFSTYFVPIYHKRRQEADEEDERVSLSGGDKWEKGGWWR